MKRHLRLISFVMTLLVLMLTVQPSKGFAQPVHEDGLNGVTLSAEALEALDHSIYINTLTKTAHIAPYLASNYYDFIDEELNAIQQSLDQLTEVEFDYLIEQSVNSDGDGIQLRSASVIVWVEVTVILAIVATTALYFSLTYMNHLEKQNLIDRCYEVGGTPIIDSGDIGDIGGEPEKVWWKISNTYTLVVQNKYYYMNFLKKRYPASSCTSLFLLNLALLIIRLTRYGHRYFQ